MTAQQIEMAWRAYKTDVAMAAIAALARGLPPGYLLVNATDVLLEALYEAGISKEKLRDMVMKTAEISTMAMNGLELQERPPKEFEI
jgi:hypothetical protein